MRALRCADAYHVIVIRNPLPSHELHRVQSGSPRKHYAIIRVDRWVVTEHLAVHTRAKLPSAAQGGREVEVKLPVLEVVSAEQSTILPLSDQSQHAGEVLHQCARLSKERHTMRQVDVCDVVVTDESALRLEIRIDRSDRVVETERAAVAIE